MTTATPGARLLAELTRLQRRAATADAVGHAVLGAGAGIGIAALAALQLDLAPAGAAWTAGGLLVFAILAIAGWTLVHRPTLVDVARHLDRRLRLDDRLVTALQFHADTDPFAGRIIADALTHLSGLTSAAAYPVRVPRRYWVIALACVTLPAVLLLMRPELRASSSTHAAGGPPSASARAAGPEQGTAAARNGAAAPPSRAATPADAPPARTTGRQTRPDAASAAASTPRTAPAGERMPDATSQVGTPSGPGARPGSPGAAPRADAANAAATRPGRAQAGAQANAQGGAGRTDTAAPVGLGAGAGGVAASDPPRANTSAPSGNRAGTLTRARWATAEQAVSRSHIPPGRRESVRRYFLGIRPSEQP